MNPKAVANVAGMFIVVTAEYDKENIRMKPLFNGTWSIATTDNPNEPSSEAGSGGREEHTKIVKMLITKSVSMHSSDPRPIVTLG